MIMLCFGANAGCPARVRSGFVEIFEASPTDLTRAFNTCTPVLNSTRAQLANWIAGNLQGNLASRAESACVNSSPT